MAMAFQYTIPPNFSATPQMIVRVQAPDFSFVPVEGVTNVVPAGGFLICFKINENWKFYYRCQRNGNDDDLMFLDGVAFRTAVYNNILFCARRDQVLNISAAIRREELSRMLTGVIVLPIDAHQSIVQTIENAIVSTMTQPENAALSFIPVLVDISIWNSRDVTNFVNAAAVAGRAQQQHVLRRTPAGRTAIESLPEVKIEDLNEVADSSCAICWEEFKETEADAEIVSMPCKHVFHRKCITHWLQISNICPLCRFELPR